MILVLLTAYHALSIALLRVHTLAFCISFRYASWTTWRTLWWTYRDENSYEKVMSKWLVGSEHQYIRCIFVFIFWKVYVYDVIMTLFLRDWFAVFPRENHVRVYTKGIREKLWTWNPCSCGGMFCLSLLLGLEFEPNLQHEICYFHIPY